MTCHLMLQTCQTTITKFNKMKYSSLNEKDDVLYACSQFVSDNYGTANI